MTIAEIKQAIESKKAEARSFTDAKDLTNANKAMEELRTLKETLKIEEELAEEEARDLNNQRENRRGDGEMGKVNEMRAIVKKMMGAEMTQEERANISTVDNGAVIPKQFVNQLQEIKKGYGSLKEYADVITVTKNEGTIPVVDLDQNTLPEVNEGDNIVDGTLVTTDLKFKCKKHGLIQSLSSEVVEDAEVEIEGLVNKNFAEIVTVAENTKIMKVLKDNATDISGTTYEDIQLTIDKSLPSVKAGLATYTNTNGFAYLKNLKDGQKRPLNLVTEMNGKYIFHGKELVVVDDSLLTPAEEKSYVFIVANAKEAVKFMDRKAVTIAKSAEAGFRDDTVKIRILERFDVVKGSTRSVKKIEF
ncbi:phage major capsid protein [Clostridium baratii]|uniref:phage major capsid protein n=1 Tax=Clostridium baratii TaxID=1561 RepID=UPI003D355066